MNKRTVTAKESSSVFVISFFVCQLLVVIVNAIGIIFATSMGYDTTDFQLFLNTAVGYLICAITLDLGMILCFWFCKRKYEFKTLSKPKANKIFIYALIGAVSFFSLYPIVNCIDSMLVSWGLELSTIPYNLTMSNYFISLISLCLFPAVCEELLFRGLIMQGFRRYGKWIAIIISSVMFSLFHMSIFQTIYPLLFGLFLGGIMYREENILYSITAHAINNFLSLTFSYLNISLVFNHWSYILLAIILCAIWLSVILFLIKRIPSVDRVKFTRSELAFTLTSLVIMIIMWIIMLLA